MERYNITVSLTTGGILFRTDKTMTRAKSLESMTVVYLDLLQVYQEPTYTVELTKVITTCQTIYT